MGRGCCCNDSGRHALCPPCITVQLSGFDGNVIDHCAECEDNTNVGLWLQEPRFGSLVAIDGWYRLRMVRMYDPAEMPGLILGTNAAAVVKYQAHLQDVRMRAHRHLPCDTGPGTGISVIWPRDTSSFGDASTIEVVAECEKDTHEVHVRSIYWYHDTPHADSVQPFIRRRLNANLFWADGTDAGEHPLTETSDNELTGCRDASGRLFAPRAFHWPSYYDIPSDLDWMEPLLLPNMFEDGKITVPRDSRCRNCVYIFGADFDCDTREFDISSSVGTECSTAHEVIGPRWTFEGWSAGSPLFESRVLGGYCHDAGDCTAPPPDPTPPPEPGCVCWHKFRRTYNCLDDFPAWSPPEHVEHVCQPDAPGPTTWEIESPFGCVHVATVWVEGPDDCLGYDPDDEAIAARIPLGAPHPNSECANHPTPPAAPEDPDCGECVERCFFLWSQEINCVAGTTGPVTLIDTQCMFGPPEDQAVDSWFTHQPGVPQWPSLCMAEVRQWTVGAVCDPESPDCESEPTPPAGIPDGAIPGRCALRCLTRCATLYELTYDCDTESFDGPHELTTICIEAFEADMIEDDWSPIDTDDPCILKWRVWSVGELCIDDEDCESTAPPPNPTPDCSECEDEECPDCTNCEGECNDSLSSVSVPVPGNLKDCSGNEYDAENVLATNSGFSCSADFEAEYAGEGSGPNNSNLLILVRFESFGNNNVWYLSFVDQGSGSVWDGCKGGDSPVGTYTYDTQTCGGSNNSGITAITVS